MSISGGVVFVSYRLVDFIAQYADLTGRLDPEANLITIDTDHRDCNGVTYGQTLSGTTAKNQHDLG